MTLYHTTTFLKIIDMEKIRTLRLSEEDNQLLKRIAQENRMSVSAYVRNKLFCK